MLEARLTVIHHRLLAAVLCLSLHLMPDCGARLSHNQRILIRPEPHQPRRRREKKFTPPRAKQFQGQRIHSASQESILPASSLFHQKQEAYSAAVEYRWKKVIGIAFFLFFTSSSSLLFVLLEEAQLSALSFPSNPSKTSINHPRHHSPPDRHDASLILQGEATRQEGREGRCQRQEDRRQGGQEGARARRPRKPHPGHRRARHHR